MDLIRARCPPVAVAAALRGTGQDGDDDAPFSRVRRLARTAATASLGCLFGVLALRSGRPTGVTLCLITAAFVAGLISVYGASRRRRACISSSAR
ncbi:hypothetical protein BM536_008170 [Streptomyces phaeoluteigriseus]|uniref:Uncharacterized protein n=1 Tax=Streptomyces phaeoluteigriseus TaxID=114686 RepID=A0A1V6MV67_9ACTN|nr:hypothetical protein BM536_008170 [Streptomyces phaeoluteigriseus]